MPVLRMHMGERPDDVVPCQSLGDVRILQDVERIIEIDELMPDGLPKDAPRDGEQNKGYGQFPRPNRICARGPVVIPGSNLGGVV